MKTKLGEILWNNSAKFYLLIKIHTQALERWVSACGSWASLLHGLWDLPGPGVKPTAAALAGGLFTTESPGKPRMNYKFRLRKKSPLLPGPIIACPASAFAPALSLWWVYLGSRSPLLLVSSPLEGWGVAHCESM